MAENRTRYSLLDLPAKDRLVKLDDELGLGFRWRGGQRVENERACGLVTGLAGDSNYEEISQAEEKNYLAGEWVTWEKGDFWIE